MRLEIRRRRLAVSDGLRDHIKRRLRTALGRFARRVGQVWVYLRDVNGPRGGADKRCRIVVHLLRGGRAVTTGAGPDVYTVVTHTAASSARVVKRRLKRQAALRLRRRRGEGRMRTAA
jgi:putative sigma-54 modulation protein